MKNIKIAVPGSDEDHDSLTPREPDILLEMENLFGISDMYKRSIM